MKKVRFLAVDNIFDVIELCHAPRNGKPLSHSCRLTLAIQSPHASLLVQSVLLCAEILFYAHSIVSYAVSVC